MHMYEIKTTFIAQIKVYIRDLIKILKILCQRSAEYYKTLNKQ